MFEMNTFISYLFVGKAGFEPATNGLEVRRSVQLSYLPFLNYAPSMFLKSNER